MVIGDSAESVGDATIHSARSAFGRHFYTTPELNAFIQPELDGEGKTC